jgi:peptide/nickel transport system substrate-binding protein
MQQGNALQHAARHHPLRIVTLLSCRCPAVVLSVFNNLVLFDQHKERNTIDTIVPDLAESWTWSEDGKELTIKLRHGVKWHDGKPFTTADVKCTWDLLQGNTQEKLRLNPRKAWYRNLDQVTTDGDDGVIFHQGIALTGPPPGRRSRAGAGIKERPPGCGRKCRRSLSAR